MKMYSFMGIKDDGNVMFGTASAVSRQEMVGKVICDHEAKTAYVSRLDDDLLLNYLKDKAMDNKLFRDLLIEWSSKLILEAKND